MTHYEKYRDRFLDSCGPLTEEEKAKATEAFDKTTVAAQARLLDSIDSFSKSLTRYIESLEK